MKTVSKCPGFYTMELLKVRGIAFYCAGHVLCRNEEYLHELES
jgi:hypothetical protein